MCDHVILETCVGFKGIIFRPMEFFKNKNYNGSCAFITKIENISFMLVLCYDLKLIDIKTSAKSLERVTQLTNTSIYVYACIGYIFF